MTRRKADLPKCAKAYLQRATTPIAEQIVWQFHRWLVEQGHELKALNQSQIDQFLAQPWKAPVAPSTQSIYRTALQRYLTELYVQGQINFYREESVRVRKASSATTQFTLPAYAQEYLNADPTKRNSNRLMRFHRWLAQNERQLSDFRPWHIEEFVKKPFRNKTKPNVEKSYRRWLFTYLSFLHKKKLLFFDPEHSRSHPKYLPAHATEFLKELAVTLKSGTVNSYRSDMRSFHNFIDRNNMTLRELDRLQICQWLSHLVKRGLHPATRRATIINIRTYLRWLHEREILTTDPQTLIRSSDFPKLPEYLPRPLSPQTDKALQDLLMQWKTIYAKGLLLMRKTGMRIGELQSLEYDCLRTDLHGNYFLKVPLGKLNNERLVPINPETAQLVEEIKQRTPSPRKYLISTTLTKKEKRHLLIAQIKRASKKLSVPIQSHQLRHSCATELMSAGMTLPSIMRFLGHRDYRMTLRYAKITQETLVREFGRATEQIGERYNIPLLPENQEPFDPGALLSNVIGWLLTNAPSHRKRNVDLITKRLHRIKRDIKKYKLQ